MKNQKAMLVGRQGFTTILAITIALAVVGGVAYVVATKQSVSSLSPSKINAYGKLLSNWAGEQGVIVSVGGKNINGYMCGPAGGSSFLPWSGEFRDNFKAVVQKSSCEPAQLESTFGRLFDFVPWQPPPIDPATDPTGVLRKVQSAQKDKKVKVLLPIETVQEELQCMDISISHFGCL